MSAKIQKVLEEINNWSNKEIGFKETKREDFYERNISEENEVALRGGLFGRTSPWDRDPLE